MINKKYRPARLSKGLALSRCVQDAKERPYSDDRIVDRSDRVQCDKLHQCDDGWPDPPKVLLHNGSSLLVVHDRIVLARRSTSRRHQNTLEMSSTAMHAKINRETMMRMVVEMIVWPAETRPFTNPGHRERL